MSGGHFDYKQMYIKYISDEIQHIIEINESEERNQYGDKVGYGFSKETIAEFKKAVYILDMAAIYAQRIDWLVSEDDGEDTFIERLHEELSKL